MKTNEHPTTDPLYAKAHELKNQGRDQAAADKLHDWLKQYPADLPALGDPSNPTEFWENNVGAADLDMDDWEFEE